MRIVIRTETLSKNIIEQWEVRWKIHFQKVKGALIVFGALAVVFLIIGIFSEYDNSITNTGERKGLFINIGIYIGVSCLLVFLYLILQIVKAKKIHMITAQALATKFEAINEIIYEFNESNLVIDRKVHFEKIDWHIFSNKLYYEKFIFLNYSSNRNDGIMIDGSLFSERDLSAIKEIIDRNVS
jgi:hypothetical protein